MKTTNIKCIKFQKQSPGIKAITRKISGAESEELLWCARRLRKEAGVLLDCSGYAEEVTDCKDCRTVANAYNVLAKYIIDG
jgi:hypothetical protein